MKTALIKGLIERVSKKREGNLHNLMYFNIILCSRWHFIHKFKIIHKSGAETFGCISDQKLEAGN